MRLWISENSENGNYSYCFSEMDCATCFGEVAWHIGLALYSTVTDV